MFSEWNKVACSFCPVCLSVAKETLTLAILCIHIQMTPKVNGLVTFTATFFLKVAIFSLPGHKCPENPDGVFVVVHRENFNHTFHTH